MKENKMGVMPIDKLIISMSLPIMISMLVQALYSIMRVYLAFLFVGVPCMAFLAFCLTGNGKNGLDKITCFSLWMLFCYLT